MSSYHPEQIHYTDFERLRKVEVFEGVVLNRSVDGWWVLISTMPPTRSNCKMILASFGRSKPSGLKSLRRLRAKVRMDREQCKESDHCCPRSVRSYVARIGLTPLSRFA